MPSVTTLYQWYIAPIADARDTYIPTLIGVVTYNFSRRGSIGEATSEGRILHSTVHWSTSPIGNSARGDPTLPYACCRPLIIDLHNIPHKTPTSPFSTMGSDELNINP
jgi:hypothetical protein